MTRLCFQYLAIFSNENLPKRIQIVPNWVEKLQNIFKYWPKWWNFAKSGHIGYQLDDANHSIVRSSNLSAFNKSHFVKQCTSLSNNAFDKPKSQPNGQAFFPLPICYETLPPFEGKLFKKTFDNFVRMKQTKFLRKVAFFQVGQPRPLFGSFSFFSNTQYYRKNCRLQQDSN